MQIKQKVRDVAGGERVGGGEADISGSFSCPLNKRLLLTELDMIIS